MSMLDGFFGYNKILFVEEDRCKTTLTTPRGTYAYIKSYQCSQKDEKRFDPNSHVC